MLGVTGGRVGWSVDGMPVIELTTTGRVSGEVRTTMLTLHPIRRANPSVSSAPAGSTAR
ncbi:MAG: nitroreductase/quinone reductase family protein [Actinomycetota bacterium]|nr:nitroreductase/quinone reductase family protein [Actinomycetota bacterium]